MTSPAKKEILPDRPAWAKRERDSLDVGRIRSDLLGERRGRSPADARKFGRIALSASTAIAGRDVAWKAPASRSTVAAAPITAARFRRKAFRQVVPLTRINPFLSIRCHATGDNRQRRWAWHGC